MLRWIARASIVVLLAAGLVGLWAWYKLDGGFVPRTSVAALADLLAPAFIVDRPDPARFGPGPYPAVLLFDGCGGLTRDGTARTVTGDYARVANELGVMAITVDSFGPRGIDERRAIDDVCSGWILRGPQRAGDVIAALKAVRDMPDVDPFRLAIAGWSHGGWTVMDVLTFDFVKDRPHGIADRYDEALSGVAFAFAVYPYCGFASRTGRRGWQAGIPVIAILVQNDERVSTEDCLASLDRVRAAGADVDVRIMKDVTHAFDESDLRPGDRYRFDPATAANARDIFRNAIREHLLVTPSG